MDNCIHHFKNTLTSSSPANFRLDIFYSKTLLYSFWGIENGLKADRTCKISHLNICLHNHISICLHIAYEHIHLTPGRSYSVRVAGQVLNTHNC